MEKYLYKDLAQLEDSHWWHISKRETVSNLMKRFYRSLRSFQNDKKLKPRILDIGCGTGRNVIEFSKFGQVWGIDNSKEAIKFCKQKGLKNVGLGSSDKTGFGSETFDVVTLLDVLEHVEEGKTLFEIKRILKKDGVLIITVPAFSWLWSQWDVVLHHKRRYTKESLAKVLLKNGFKVQKISYMYSFLVLPVLVVRFIKSLFFKENYGSDFELSSPVINKLFLGISRIERAVIMKYQLPVGTSLICVASLKGYSSIFLNPRSFCCSWHIF